jgi:hypothetical protein
MMRISAARFGVRLSGMVIQSLTQDEERVLALELVQSIRMQSDAFEEDLQIEPVEGAGVRFFGCQAKD